MINAFVESLSRLFIEKKISKEKVDELFSSNKITRLDYEYILKSAEIAGKEM